MAAKKDFSQHALSIVEQATGDGPLAGDRKEEKTAAENSDGKNAAAVSRGRLGGLIGGKVRAENLTPEQRREAGQKAARARWSKKN